MFVHFRLQCTVKDGFCSLWDGLRLCEVAVHACASQCPLQSVQFKHYVGLPWMILGHFSGCMQWLLWRTRPAGHWQPGTQGLKQWLSISPRGTSTLKQVTGHGGPHSSNTKPLSTGQPTAGEDSDRGEKLLHTDNTFSTIVSRVWINWPLVISKNQQVADDYSFKPLFKLENCWGWCSSASA